MPTKRIFDMVVIVTIASRAAMGLAKLWAARHSTHDGVDGVLARSVQVL